MAIARALGLSSKGVSKWFNAESLPRQEKMNALARLLKVDVVWLQHGHIQSTKENPVEYAGKIRSGIVPVRGDASLGVDGAIDMTERNEGWLRAYSRDPNAYAIHTSGDSMWPRIKSGDYVLIEPAATVLPGDEVFVRTKDDHNMIKVLGYDRDGEYQFVSINQDHRPVTYRHADIKKIEFVAGIFKKTLFMDDDEAREYLRA